MLRSAVFSLVLVAAACGTNPPSWVDGGSDAGPTDGGPTDAGPTDAGPTDAGPADAGPVLTVRLKATTVAFPHADLLSGQTPTNTKAGVRSLKLLRSALDAAPLTLLDLGTGAIEVGYDNGNETVIARVPTAALASGHFTLVRMVQAWSQFRIDATLHSGGKSDAGTLDELMVTSNRAVVNGTERDAGHLEYTFTCNAGTSSAVIENVPVPVFSTTAGAWAVVENGEWAVYYPVSLDVLPFATDRQLVITVNMDHAFRWSDNLLGVGYQVGVFDFEPPWSEVVVRFGGNKFDAVIP